MKIDFRQGIVTYPESTGGQAFLQVAGGGTDVNILTGSGETTVAFAQRTADYLHVETNPIIPAWSGLPVTEAWIYWDINPQTGVVSYGFTEVQPTSGPTQPGILVADQHWFDTVVNVMKVYDGTRFLEKIRVFAARIVGTTLTPFGSNLAKPYAGTQVGINQTTFAGQILFAQGLPVIVSIPSSFSPTVTNPFARNFIFATTETEFIAGSSQKVTNIRLESDVSTAQASIAIAAFDVVQYSDFGIITPANYNDTESTTIAMVTDDVAVGEIVSVIYQGTITNEAWNWPTVGQELFILAAGELTKDDPNITTPSLYPVSKPPVARVVSEKEIIFMQGLGKVGPRGLNPESIDTIGDVTITNGLENDILKLTGSPVIWRNSRVTLDELSDVEITSVSPSQALVFSGSPQLWRNSDVFATDFGSPLADEDFVQYSSTSSNWENVTRREGNVGYFGVEPIVRNASQAFVATDAGKGVLSTLNGSPEGTTETWTLDADVFELGDVITLVRQFNTGQAITIDTGPNVQIISQIDGTDTTVGSPLPVFALDNPAQVTLWLTSTVGSPYGVGSPGGTDVWFINGSGVTTA